MQKPTFSNSHIYHIYNRGVEKRKIFLDDKDRFCFVHDLFEFNDEAPAANIYYKLPHFQSYEVGLRKIEERQKQEREPRKCLVEILAFCLMTNHFHLILRQKINKGIPMFMQKLGTGYTNYFNNKYERVGSLFQGKYKAILINNESHFIHLPYYIHTNPLSIIEPNWLENDLKNMKKAITFLESYRWSSHLDYIGKKNFPSVTQRDFLLEFFGGTAQYKIDLFHWLEERNIEAIKGLTLE